VAVRASGGIRWGLNAQDECPPKLFRKPKSHSPKPVKEKIMSNAFVSFLKAVGNGFKKGLPVVLGIAKVADVGISIVNPALGGLIATSISTVMSVEQKFAAIGATGAGPQKLAESVQILYPAFEQIFGQYGVQIDNSHVENYVNAIVAALNAFPAIPVNSTPVAAAKAGPDAVAQAAG
jgi:hypothetical protein